MVGQGGFADIFKFKGLIENSNESTNNKLQDEEYFVVK